MAHKLAKIDFMKLFREYAEMPVWHGAFDEVGLPVVRIRWSARNREIVSGACSMKRQNEIGLGALLGKPTSRAKIRLTIYANSRVGDVIQTVLHEMTHAAGWMEHSHRFYNTLREAVAMATGVDCDRTWTKVYEYDRYQQDDLNAYYGDTYTGLPLLARPTKTQGAPVKRAAKRRKATARKPVVSRGEAKATAAEILSTFNFD